MKSLHLHFALLVLLLLSTLGVSTSNVQAATSILPGYEYTEWVCDPSEDGYDETVEAIREQATFEEIFQECGSTCAEELLGCAIKQGLVRFWMVPFYINYALEFVISVAGVLAVLMVIVGGYFYIYGAVTDDKEKGKTVISYALGGYALVLVSWFIVNALLLLVTQ